MCRQFLEPESAVTTLEGSVCEDLLCKLCRLVRGLVLQGQHQRRSSVFDIFDTVFECGLGLQLFLQGITSVTHLWGLLLYEQHVTCTQNQSCKMNTRGTSDMNVRECRCMEIITSALQRFGSVLVNCQVFEFFRCNFRWKKRRGYAFSCPWSFTFFIFFIIA